MSRSADEYPRRVPDVASMIMPMTVGTTAERLGLCMIAKENDCQESRSVKPKICKVI